MPFDGSNRAKKRPKTDPTGEQSFPILAEMESYYGKAGEKWAQGVRQTLDGRCCLMAAVMRARTTPDPHLIAGDRATEYLAKAIWADDWETHHRFAEISHWNDLACDFSQIAAVLETAKGLAAADMETAKIQDAIAHEEAAPQTKEKKPRRRRILSQLLTA